MASNLYNELGLPFDATVDEIRSAYFRAAKQFHPDVNKSPGDQERFLRVQDAFQILSDSKKRAAYDATLPSELRDPLAIEVNVLYSLPGLPRLREPQRLYAILEVQAAGRATTTRPPVHVCLVIDRSTSMQGKWLDQIKHSLAQTLALLNPNDLISVVAFSDRAQVVTPPTAASELATILESVRLLTAHGATEIYQGLSQGYKVLANQPQPGYARHLVLFTDGHTYGDEQQCFELAESASAAGIAISGFGFGHEWNDEFLDRLAAYSGEQAVFVNSPKELYNYLETRLLSFNTRFASGVRFEYETSPNVCLQDAFRLQPAEAPVIVSSPMVLGDLPTYKSLRILLEFLVHPIPSDETVVNLLVGKLLLEFPERVVHTYRVHVHLNRLVRSLNRREIIPGSIMQAVSRLNLYRMQAKAREEAQSGQIEKAVNRLRNIATHLLAEGESKLANEIIQESESLQATRCLSEEGVKRIKYGTRSLFLLPNPEQSTQ